MSKIHEIEIKEIDVVENHRLNVDSTNIDELMMSIKQHGLKQPISVFKQGERYSLIFGNRRLQACKKLGWKTVPAIIETDINEEKHLVINLTENMQRKDPSFAELGRVIKKLQDKFNLSTAEVSARIGFPVAKVQSIIKVYELLPEKYRDRVFFMDKGAMKRGENNNRIPATVAVKIVNLKKSYGLSDKSVDGLIKHVSKNGADSKDLENIGILMSSGLSHTEAIEKTSQYCVYSFNFVAKVNDVKNKMSDHDLYTKQDLFRKIMYGEVPGLQKPDFLVKKTKKLSPEEKKDMNIKRLANMRNYLAVQDRLKKLDVEQSNALRATANISPKDWTEAQTIQVESMYRDVFYGNKKEAVTV